MAQHLRSISERKAAIESAAGKLRATVGALDAVGLPAKVVTGGGTGTFPLEIASGVYNEIQPGSYIFMDADYDRNEWAERPWFAQSLFVLTTVMSTAGTGRAVVDAGLKASSVDSGLPLIDAGGALAYVNASDEHGVLRVPSGARAPRLGDRLRLIPGHCDPTVNLYDWLVAVRADRVEALWPISARGCGA
jgi:D-serine deaminase-like pyridoxal phosphate-dependent protein